METSLATVPVLFATITATYLSAFILEISRYVVASSVTVIITLLSALDSLAFNGTEGPTVSTGCCHQ